MKAANIKRNKKATPFRVKEGVWQHQKDAANALKREKQRKVNHSNKVKCYEDDYSDAALREYCR